MNQAQRPSIEFMVLADSAEVVNGKLYMLGGGWDRMTVADFAEPVALSVVVGVSIPEESAQQVLTLQVRLINNEGSVLPPELSGTLARIGPPAHVIPDQPVRLMAAFNAVWKFLQPGLFTVEAGIDGARKSLAFEVMPLDVQQQAVGQ